MACLVDCVAKSFYERKERKGYKECKEHDGHNIIMPRAAEPRANVVYPIHRVRMTFSGSHQGKYLIFSAETDKFFAAHEGQSFVQRKKNMPGHYLLRTTIRLDDQCYIALEWKTYDLTMILVDGELILKRIDPAN